MKIDKPSSQILILSMSLALSHSIYFNKDYTARTLDILRNGTFAQKIHISYINFI